MEHCNTTITRTTFSLISQGAIHTTDTNINFVQSSLTQNGISTPSFPSARQNIRCVGTGTLTYDLTTAGLTDVKDLWVNADEGCKVEGDTALDDYLFFLPTLTTGKCKSEEEVKDNAFSVRIVGTKLLPCGLSLEVFEKLSSRNTEPVTIQLSDIANEWNETSLNLTVPKSTLSSLSTKDEWLGRLRFGREGQTETFQFKMSAKQARSKLMEKNIPWMIPLIIALSVLLLLSIIILCLLRRRRQQKQNKQNDSEMLPQAPIEDDKIEVISEETALNANNSAISTINSKERAQMNTRPQDEDTPASFEAAIPNEECVEALACSGKMEMTVVRKQDTLYTRLHTEQGKRIALTKESVRQQLLQGIMKIWETDKHAPLLTQLSSHIVMVDAANNVFLSVGSTEDRTTQHQLEQNTLGVKGEGKRWCAPELLNEKGQNSNNDQVIDPSKAAVFSLGLILWEMETGLVPFGEVDVVNAQRQLGLGSALKMDGVKDESTRDIIASCLTVNPKERPSLQTLHEFINPKKDDQHLPSNWSGA
ncbi:hypothetical protein BLNAU_18210 [Blattamonas nauphoetae]|uniref:Protein kinase domain-containing protein n=1 Tax=Blattamonas nauphoetae TaxID=2049346 RepID=A0ABQ9X5G9_9EUKA|nr:hypothetical protein BLNAU_18210 [Blattamonas nauphoetae]